MIKNPPQKVIITRHPSDLIGIRLLLLGMQQSHKLPNDPRDLLIPQPPTRK